MGMVDELKNKVKDNGFDESMKEIARRSGLELSDEQLNVIAGGLMNCESDDELRDLIRLSGYELSDKQLNGNGVNGCGHCYCACDPDCVENWMPI